MGTLSFLNTYCEGWQLGLHPHQGILAYPLNPLHEMRTRDRPLMNHPAWTPILQAAEGNDSWAFWILRSERSGVTPLMKAALSSCEQALIALLPYENPRAQCLAGKTALMCAAERGAVACCQILIGCSDALAVDDQGHSAWDVAINSECKDVIQPAVRAFFEHTFLNQTLAAPPESPPTLGCKSARL